MKWLNGFFSDKMKMYGIAGISLLLMLLSNAFWLSRNGGLKSDVKNLTTDLRLKNIECGILKTHVDSLKVKNARLNLTILLNNCNSYKIHEKVNSIPNDSLLLYADSLLSKPIPKFARQKSGNIGAAATKLLRIPRTLFGRKGEDCCQ